MAEPISEPAMPICSMQSAPFIKVHCPWYIFKVVKIILNVVTHGCCFEFFLNMEQTRPRPEMVHARGCHSGKNKLVILVDGDGLFGQVDFDPTRTYHSWWR